MAAGVTAAIAADSAETLMTFPWDFSFATNKPMLCPWRKWLPHLLQMMLHLVQFAPAETAIPHWRQAVHSLRLRLVLIPTVILACGLLVAAMLALHGASTCIHREAASSLAVGRLLVQAALRTVADAASPREALQEVEAQLLSVRHLDIVVMPGEQAEATGLTPLSLGDRPNVPDWFERMLRPPLATDTFPVVFHQERIGQVLLRSNPYDDTIKALLAIIGLHLSGSMPDPNSGRAIAFGPACLRPERVRHCEPASAWQSRATWTHVLARGPGLPRRKRSSQ